MTTKLEPWTRDMGPKRWGMRFTQEQESWRPGAKISFAMLLQLSADVVDFQDNWNLSALLAQACMERAGLGIRPRAVITKDGAK